ncbi:hypothetical protein PG996_003773 [Apiospora saccharicola]|uniref:Uncharacterized protein n=1 Tax=Apiospora saccharicola TaxID=335842 RepID=A0ABR1W2B6_9PEZI
MSDININLQQRYRFAKKRKLDDDKELSFKDSGLADKNSAVVYQSYDLVLKQGEILDRYGDLILRSSPHLNTDMKNHEIIERHLVVLFGLTRAFKIGVFITVLLDIAKKQNRLESQISSLKEEQK